MHNKLKPKEYFSFFFSHSLDEKLHALMIAARNPKYSEAIETGADLPAESLSE
jgi:hypothetical protein